MYNMKAYRNETYNNIYLRQTRCKPVDKTYFSKHKYTNLSRIEKKKCWIVF